MFKKLPPLQTGLEAAIEQLLFEMRGFPAESDEYAQCVQQLDTLYKLKDIDKTERVKPDTYALIAGHLAGILVIVLFERNNVLATKALGFVKKLA